MENYTLLPFFGYLCANFPKRTNRKAIRTHDMKLTPIDRAPLLPLALCLVAGIAVGNPFGTGWPLMVVAGVLLAVTLLAGRWPLVQSLGVWLCFVVLGMLVAPAEEGGVADGVWTEAVVASPIAERPKTVMADLLLTPSGERRRCYLWKDERSLQLKPADNLVVSIHDRQFVSRDGWQRGGNGLSHLSAFQRLRLKALLWREWALQRLHASAADADAQAVVAAMVLGDKRALTRELRDVYSVSGASHVLALSGLHLSIIYLLLTRLTLGRRRFWLGQVLIVASLWAFTLLTGLSTSLVRAATMLTVYALFALGGRRHAPLGVLSFTAIVMLLFDSSALFDVGFQLSFMAMLGIILFMPLFDDKSPGLKSGIYYKVTHGAGINYLSRGWWDGIKRNSLGYLLVSVAAQLGTAPLIAFYFGRFSTWFLLTNLVVIPLATLILFGAVVVLLFPAAAGLLLMVVGWMNAFLSFVSRLPLASIDHLQPSVLQVVLIYVVIAVIYALLFRLVGRRR